MVKLKDIHQKNLNQSSFERTRLESDNQIKNKKKKINISEKISSGKKIVKNISRRLVRPIGNNKVNNSIHDNHEDRIHTNIDFDNFDDSAVCDPNQKTVDLLEIPMQFFPGNKT